MRFVFSSFLLLFFLVSPAFSGNISPSNWFDKSYLSSDDGSLAAAKFTRTAGLENGNLDLNGAEEIVHLAETATGAKRVFAFVLLRIAHLGWSVLRNRIEKILEDEISNPRSDCRWLAMNIVLQINKSKSFQVVPNGNNLGDSVLAYFVAFKSKQTMAGKLLAQTLANSESTILQPRVAFFEALKAVDELASAQSIFSLGAILFRCRYYRSAKAIFDTLKAHPKGISPHEIGETEDYLKKFL